jgi:hypothetical protein
VYRAVFISVAVAALGVAGAAGYAAASSPELQHPVVIRTLEVGGSFSFVDFHKKGDSAGDIQTIWHQLWDHKQTHRLGRVQVVCHDIQAKPLWLECTASMILHDGIVEVAGPFHLNPDGSLPVNVWAVTGGTGRFRNARGFMTLPPAPNGLLYHDLYLEP